MEMTDSDTTILDPKVLREQEIVAARSGLGAMPDKTLNDFGFALNRLHDPSNFDHTTLEDMLAEYKVRDMATSKLFRLGQKIFGDKMDPKFKARTRNFNVTGLKKAVPGSWVPSTVTHDKTADTDSDDDLVDMGDMRLHKKVIPVKYQENEMATSDADGLSEDAVNDYKKWISDRQQLRWEMDKLGLCEKWLANKASKTDVELAMYQQIMDAKILPPESVQVEDDTQSLIGELPPGVIVLPKIRRPSPIAVRRLERFIKTNRLRLVDIFTAIDKNKNWKVSRDEFLAAIDQYNMNISPSLLEDLLTTFDEHNDGELNYKALAKGIDLWKLERRDIMKKNLPADDSDAESDSEVPVIISPTSSRKSDKQRSGSNSAKSKSVRVKSGASTTSVATTLLETPELDTQESILMLDSKERQVDLRKRDKGFLRLYQKGTFESISSDTNRQYSFANGANFQVFKTGHQAVDDHCHLSTLEGENAEMVNKFRQLKLKEYHEIVKLCEKEGVVLDQTLLDRVLLHPGDKSKKQMLRQGISQAGSHLPLSRHFADPPKRPRTPIEVRNKGKMKRNEDGSLWIDYKHQFKTQAKAARRPHKVLLSTGRAHIARQVDCWLTFEEYDCMTKDYYKKRYVRMGGQTDYSAFWPGYMLDKLRLIIPNDRTATESNSVFHHVRKEQRHNFGYDNDLNNWNVSDKGYLLQASLRHPKKFYDTSNKQPSVERQLNYKNHFVHKVTDNLTMHTNTK